MLCDFHLHTDFSGDCTTPARDQIDKAISLGMDRICITDHHDPDVVSDCDFNLDLDSYFPAMRQLKEEYKDRIRIEIGIELGLQCHIADPLKELTERYDFDFIIGSSHFVDGMDPYYEEYFRDRSRKEAYRRFFEVSLDRVKMIDCFDSYGHLDYIVRYDRPMKNYDPSEYLEYIDAILQTLIDKGKALECNTGGFSYGTGFPNPKPEILKRYRQMGGELITVGSDAHIPEDVGTHFNETAGLLKDCGFRYYTVYHNRKPEFLPL